MDNEKQHIRSRAIIEVIGKPKDHIETTMKKYIEQISTDETLILLNKSISEAKELKKDKVWSTFAELEMIFKGTTALASFCFYYMPSSVEIVKPEKLSLKNHEFSNIINDLQSKLHTVDMVAKKLKMENDFLKRNMKASLKNYISVLLKIREMNIGELSGFMGINKDELKLIIDDLVKEGKIKHQENKYILQA